MPPFWGPRLPRCSPPHGSPQSLRTGRTPLVGEGAGGLPRLNGSVVRVRRGRRGKVRQSLLSCQAQAEVGKVPKGARAGPVAGGGSEQEGGELRGWDSSWDRGGGLIYFLQLPPGAETGAGGPKSVGL